MKRSRGGTEEDAPLEKGPTDRRSKTDRQQSDDDDDDDSDSGCGASGLRNKNDKNDNNPVLRREIRSKYRDLINTVQQNREDMLNPCNNKLSEVLEQANKLFEDVRQTREAALDSQLLVMASDLGKEKANQMFSEGIAFDTTTFAEHLLSFMGLNRLEDEEDDQNGEMIEGYLPQDAWHRLASRAECCFRTAPSFHYMMGSFHAEPPPTKQRIVRQARVTTKDTQRIVPTQLKKMEESNQEATEKEVERIMGYLKRYHEDDPTSPIPYYEFVIDPDSFSQTVQNIFHTSFLIRDGMARVHVVQEQPCIAPVEEDAEDAISRNQCIISMTQKMWKELINIYDITKTMIPQTQSQ